MLLNISVVLVFCFFFYWWLVLHSKSSVSLIRKYNMFFHPVLFLVLSSVTKTIINMLFIFLNKSGVSNFIKNMFNFIKNWQGVFKIFHFTFPATEYESSTFSPSLPTLGIISLFFFFFWNLEVMFITMTVVIIHRYMHMFKPT